MVKNLKYNKSLLIFLCLIILSSCASVKNVSYNLGDNLFYADNQPETASEEIIRIVQISDLHSNDYGKDQERLIDSIKSAAPDVVFFTGDIFDFEFAEEKAVQRVKEVVAAVSEICPFFYVSGNHEYYLGHDNEYAFVFTDAGGVVLDNQVMEMDLKGLHLVIAGVSDPICYVDEKKRANDALDLDVYKSELSAVAKTSGSLEGDVHILLAHRPEFIDLYKAPEVYDLILSGHAHGGQWRLPFINGLYAPGQGLFPKYAGGRYDFMDKTKTSVFIVSRGLSYQRPLFPRFFNPPEVVEILIQAEAFRK